MFPSATTISASTVETVPLLGPMVRLRSAKADWNVRRERQGLVMGSSAPRWFELDHDPRATLMKSSHRRRTWRVTLPDGVIFAKVFDARRGNLFRRVAGLIGLGTPHREWRSSMAAEWRGVPAIRCLGLGVD